MHITNATFPPRTHHVDIKILSVHPAHVQEIIMRAEEESLRDLTLNDLTRGLGQNHDQDHHRTVDLALGATPVQDLILTHAVDPTADLHHVQDLEVEHLRHIDIPILDLL
eukprot:TRINITY_DN3905_c0_g1_i1.p2 TRINITY_DN3905_c0_g1~~TRINITY_DN3905_c0_g1_i1.p2  ORF type:complete len:110 (-),score=7.86 TRINITY_DN3905_c0_g1_i1:359-688(-)